MYYGVLCSPLSALDKTFDDDGDEDDDDDDKNELSSCYETRDGTLPARYGVRNNSEMHYLIY